MLGMWEGGEQHGWIRWCADPGNPQAPPSEGPSRSRCVACWCEGAWTEPCPPHDHLHPTPCLLLPTTSPSQRMVEALKRERFGSIFAYLAGDDAADADLDLCAVVQVAQWAVFVWWGVGRRGTVGLVRWDRDRGVCSVRHGGLRGAGGWVAHPAQMGTRDDTCHHWGTTDLNEFHALPMQHPLSLARMRSSWTPSTQR